MKTHEKDPNEVPRYRKRAQKHGSKKSDHKHSYSKCVFEYGVYSFDRRRGHILGDKTAFGIGTYCTVCGKIGEVNFVNAWEELNPETRTLPYFRIQDCFQKKVELTP